MKMDLRINAVILVMVYELAAVVYGAPCGCPGMMRGSSVDRDQVYPVCPLR